MNSKNKMYIGIILFCLFIAYRYAGLDILIKNILPKESLPVKFKNYQDLSQIKNFDNHTVKLLHKNKKFEGIFEIFEGPENEIIVKGVKESKYFDYGAGNNETILTNVLFRLDEMGNVIDTINYKTSSSNQSKLGNMIFINNQLVNKDLLYYYAGSPFERNKIKMEFIPINKNLVWDSEKIASYLDGVLNRSKYIESYYCWRDRAIPSDRRSSLIFLLNDRWHILYGLSDDFYKYYSKQTFESNDKKSSEALPFCKYPNNNIECKYYQNIKYGSDTMGSHNGSGTYDYYFWYGTAYFNCIIGIDTLKFKKNDIYLSDYDTQSKSKYDTVKSRKDEIKELAKPYQFYTNPNIKFSLIVDENDLYIIKNKNNLR